jgi:hypothetical protein
VHPQQVLFNMPNRNATKRNIVIFQRVGMGWGFRNWSDSFYFKVADTIQEAFPDHYILRSVSDSIHADDFCFECEITDIGYADLMIGMHGADLTKAMFMPKGGTVVEMSAYFDDRQLPVCGFYGSYFNIYGHHHYLYAWNEFNDPNITETFNTTDFAVKVRRFYDFTRKMQKRP